jgi:glutathione S-transferase
LWPADGEARAHARAISAEMHAGFRDLRAHCPMELVARTPMPSLPEAVAQNVRRIIELWCFSRRRFGGAGNFLFGAFSAADAMYAPVASRFRTYLPDLAAYGDDGTAQAYVEAVFSLPGMVKWEEGARAERAQEA